MKPDTNQQDQSTAPVEKFETDSKKLVRKHMEDVNHTISEDDIRNIKVGVDPLQEEDMPPHVKE